MSNIDLSFIADRLEKISGQNKYIMMKFDSFDDRLFAVEKNISSIRKEIKAINSRQADMDKRLSK